VVSVTVQHVSDMAFALRLGGASSLSESGVLAARDALASSLGLSQASIEVDAPPTAAVRRASSDSMALRVRVRGLQSSWAAASALAAAAGSQETAAAVRNSLQADGISSVVLSAAPTLSVLLVVTLGGESPASLSAQLNANLALVNAALYASGLLVALPGQALQPAAPWPPLAPATPLQPPPQVLAGAGTSQRVVAAAACSAVFGCLLAAACVVCKRRRSHRREQQDARRKQIRMPVGWEEDAAEVTFQAEVEAGYTRSAGLLFVAKPGLSRGGTILQRTAQAATQRGRALLQGAAGVLAHDRTSRISGLLARGTGRRSASLPRMSTTFDDEEMMTQAHGNSREATLSTRREQRAQLQEGRVDEGGEHGETQI
jgi:hypothetical protein